MGKVGGFNCGGKRASNEGEGRRRGQYRRGGRATQREEECQGSTPQCRGMSGLGGRKGWMDGWGNTLIEEGGEGMGYRFMDGKPGKGKTFEM